MRGYETVEKSIFWIGGVFEPRMITHDTIGAYPELGQIKLFFNTLGYRDSGY